MEYEIWEIGVHTLEFLKNGHLYLVDGIQVPSITQILKIKFGGKYNGVSTETLKRASERGVTVHKAIETFCESGAEEELQELRNFKFLMRLYSFDVLENEIPVILFLEGKPVAAGRVDMVIKKGDDIGGADIKCVSVLDKDYLFYQLNLYRIAYQQSYGAVWDFCYGIHLKDEKRKLVPIPIKEEMAWGLVYEFLKTRRNKNE